jgi:hypothetical protein
MRLLVAAALLLLPLAGCLQGATDDAVLDGSQVLVTGPLGLGAVLADGQALRVEGQCVGCAFSFDLQTVVPLDGWVEVRLGWDGTVDSGVVPSMRTPGGEWVEGRRGFDAARVLVKDPPLGRYTVQLNGSATFVGSITTGSFDARILDGPDRLPNLVTLVPEVERAVGSCRLEEQVEQGASRCLRLGNAVGNVGDGPLEVHLTFPEAALALGGLGQFVQRIYQEGGGARDVAAGAASLHRVHGHWHYAGLAAFALFEVDSDTGLRASQVATGNKAGFCFLDIGQMEGPDVRPSDERAETDCFLPGGAGWSMGVSVGWYDYYWSELADQYIDLAGVPDGTYELVSIADGEDSLLEIDEEDNAASVIIELRGDVVQVLERRGFWDNPEP